MRKDLNKRTLTRHLVEYALLDVFAFSYDKDEIVKLRRTIEYKNNDCSIVGRKLRRNARSLPRSVKIGIKRYLESKDAKESALISMIFLLTLDVFKKTIENYIENFGDSVTSTTISSILQSDKLATSKTINNHLRNRKTTRYIYISDETSIHLHHVATLKNNAKAYRAVINLKENLEKSRVISIIITMPAIGNNLEKAVLKKISDRTEEMRLDFEPTIHCNKADHSAFESGAFVTVLIVRSDSVSEGKFLIYNDVISELSWDKELGSVIL